MATMMRVRGWAVGAALALAVAGCGPQKQAASPPGVEWKDALDAALADADARSRPILLDFYTDW